MFKPAAVVKTALTPNLSNNYTSKATVKSPKIKAP